MSGKTEKGDIISFIVLTIIAMIFNIAICSIIVNNYNKALKKEDAIPDENEADRLKPRTGRKGTVRASTYKEDKKKVIVNKKKITIVFKLAISSLIGSLIVILLYIIMYLLRQNSEKYKILFFFICSLIGLLILYTIILTFTINGYILFGPWYKHTNSHEFRFICIVCVIYLLILIKIAIVIAIGLPFAIIMLLGKGIDKIDKKLKQK